MSNKQSTNPQHNSTSLAQHSPEDKTLMALRIELNKYQTIFLYYKSYIKKTSNNNEEASEKYPKNRSFIIFYFNPEAVSEKLIHEYFSLVGKIDHIALGSYINKSGNYKKVRKLVNYALVRFSKDTIINKTEFQLKANEYIENKRSRSIGLNFDPLEGVLDESLSEKEDDDGFVEVKQKAGSRFAVKSKGISFKIAKDEDDEESWYKEINMKKKKKRARNWSINSINSLNNSSYIKDINENKEGNDGFWNFQYVEKKKRSKNYIHA